MISREMATRTALYELEQQREKNYAEEQERIKNVLRTAPEIGQLLNERSALFASGVREAFGVRERAQEISEKLAADLDRINKTLRVELKRKGFPDDYLQPVYVCKQCKDTGYVGEPVHDLCPCVRRRMLKIMMSDEGLEDLEKQNFRTFDPEVYPDNPLPRKKSTQRQYMLKVKERMEEFADSFTPRNGKSVLLCGASGLGKTFLMNCVAERVISRGYTVLKISAYRLYDVLRNYHYDMSNADLVDNMISAELLAIDDLGTEPVTRSNNEQSGLYYILNERMSLNAPMILTTNLNSSQVRERYGDRIAARLFDAGRVSAYWLEGEDIRRFVKR